MQCVEIEDEIRFIIESAFQNYRSDSVEVADGLRGDALRDNVCVGSTGHVLGCSVLIFVFCDLEFNIKS